MQTISPWQLTFDRGGEPLRIVDPECMVAGEMGFPWQQGAEAGSRIGAAIGTRAARGNAATRVRLDVLREHESDAAARLWCLELQTVLNGYSGVTSTLLLEVPGQGTRYEMRDATIDAVDVSVVAQGRAPRTLTRWELGGTGWQALPEPGVYPLAPLHVEMVDTAEGRFMEVAFISPDLLTGNATDGWVWSGVVRAYIEGSTDLLTWTADRFVSAPGYPVAAPGGWEYRGRAVVPSRWNSVMTDLSATSNRAGKSITSVVVKDVPISLPAYPYAMPAAAATLQTHLRAAGYTGATVTSVARPLGVTIKNYLSTGAFTLQATVSAAAVTQVRHYVSGTWTPISLPAYPYALPSQRATLQTHLRAAGFAGAVVGLIGDEWTITLPNVLASATNRSLRVEIDPGDPFPSYDFSGLYVGEAPANMVMGTSGNVRTPAGAPLQEAPRQFARLVAEPV